MHTRQLVNSPGSTSPRDEFTRLIRECTRVVRRSQPALSRKDGWLLDEYHKGRGIEGLFRFANLSRQCTDPVDAAYFGEALRSFALTNHPALQLPVVDAFRVETRANSAGDLGQLEYMAAPSTATRDKAIEGLLAQLTATRAALDALHADPFSRSRPALVR